MKKMIIGLLVLSAGACASAPGETVKNDPYEDFNRSMLAFNLAVDDAVLEPAAKGYSAVTPQWGRDRVSDFFQNLGEPLTFVNEILQGNPDGAATTGLRFTVNSTIGLAGLFDIASSEGIERNDEDFGQTLAVWGVDSGPYLVMPFLGPTNPRDLVGFAADRAASPLNYVTYSGDSSDDTTIRIGVAALRGLNARAQAGDRVEQLMNQPEPYTALRSFHVTRRNAEITNGKGQNEQDVFEELPSFDEF